MLAAGGGRARPAAPARCGWTAEKVVGASGEVLAGLADVLGDDAVEETVE